MVDVKVTLYDGSFHEVDSSEIAFKIAASHCFREAMQKANAVLLEPIMKVEVVIPEEYMGDVIGDLSRRRGIVQGMDEAASAKVVQSLVPLSEMFSYATDLRSSTQGRATFTMEFNRHQEIPASITDEIVRSLTQ